jgi:hypothetical protein
MLIDTHVLSSGMRNYEDDLLDAMWLYGWGKEVRTKLEPRLYRRIKYYYMFGDNPAVIENINISVATTIRSSNLCL